VYDCTWTLDKKAEKKIEALEMWVYKRIGKIVWSEKKTNNEVLKQLKLKRELFNTVRKRQMTSSGHIKRHNSILKHTLEGKLQGNVAEADKD
jgi:hypothetical protein